MKTILVVEDHPNLGVLYQEELSEAGYRTLCACNGHEASQQMAHHHLDLVVLELDLPGMDRFDQMLVESPKLPIIINSGYSTDSFRPWPAAAFVSKSGDLSELKLQIQQVLNP